MILTSKPKSEPNSELKSASRKQAMMRRKRAFLHGGRMAGAKLSAQFLASGFLDVAPVVMGIDKKMHIALYKAMGSEIGTDNLYSDLSVGGYDCALPVVVDSPEALIFRKITGLSGLTKEPDDILPLMDPDIILVPLVACDRTGMRLGRGSGHYDRALAMLKNNRPRCVIGLAFQAQIIDKCPCEPHDVRLDAVVSEHMTMVFDAQWKRALDDYSMRKNGI